MGAPGQSGTGFKFIKIFGSVSKDDSHDFLLFGTELTFDHPDYYLTCARARTYTEHTATKNVVLEHTKPVLNKKKRTFEFWKLV